MEIFEGCFGVEMSSNHANGTEHANARVRCNQDNTSNFKVEGRMCYIQITTNCLFYKLVLLCLV